MYVHMYICSVERDIMRQLVVTLYITLEKIGHHAQNCTGR